MLSKKKEERNKHFIPPKEKPLMKKSNEGKDEKRCCDTMLENGHIHLLCHRSDRRQAGHQSH